MAELTPRSAKTFPEMLKLKRDNVDFPTWWAMVDTDEITFCQQSQGKSPTGQVKMKKCEFDKVVRWYLTGDWR